MKPRNQRPSRRAVLMRLGAVALMLAPLTVSSTPPLLPPYHDYHVAGSMVRTGGGPLNDFAVQLYWWTEWGSGWRPFEDGGVALTLENGWFAVSGREYHEVDSLKTAVVLPDTMFWGDGFAPGGPVGRDEEFVPHVDEGFFCDDTKLTTRVVGYRYQTGGVSITIP